MNFSPLELKAGYIEALYEELHNLLDKIKTAAATQNARLLLTGIIPSFHYLDLSPEALTPLPRYKALYDIRRKEQRCQLRNKYRRTGQACDPRQHAALCRKYHKHAASLPSAGPSVGGSLQLVATDGRARDGCYPPTLRYLCTNGFGAKHELPFLSRPPTPVARTNR